MLLQLTDNLSEVCACCILIASTVHIKYWMSEPFRQHRYKTHWWLNMYVGPSVTLKAPRGHLNCFQRVQSLHNIDFDWFTSLQLIFPWVYLFSEWIAEPLRKKTIFLPLSGLTCRRILWFTDLWHPIRMDASKHAQHDLSLMAELWLHVWDEKANLQEIKLVLFNLQSVFWDLLHSNCKSIWENSNIIRDRYLLNSALSLCHV